MRNFNILYHTAASDFDMQVPLGSFASSGLSQVGLYGGLMVVVIVMTVVVVAVVVVSNFGDQRRANVVV
jgi:uncharacterized membrane protein